MLSDLFRDIRLRTIAGGGLGVQLVDQDSLSGFLEGGVTYFNDNFEVAPDRDQAALRFATKFSWKISERITFTEFFVVYPKLQDGEAWVRHEAKVTTKLFEGGSAFAANIVDYDSKPSPGHRNADILWLIGLAYTF